MNEDWRVIGKELLYVASTLRNRSKGTNVSYSRKVFIPLTNFCQNFCRYCIYRRDPSDPLAKTLEPDEVEMVADDGWRVGCTEALFVTGDRPEASYQEVRVNLRKLGYVSTVEYLRDMCEMVLKRTGLLPHSNPGTISKREMGELKDVNASLGLMLENVSARLTLRGGPHESSPSKDPKLRLATIEYAGQLKIPFTTGLLIGIGETSEEVVDSLFAIKDLHDRYRHIQEVIIQNFQSKPGIPMMDHPEPSPKYVMRVAAMARLILGGDMNIQVPPNLSIQYERYLDAGVNDWGGISPITVDHINPEAPWPQI